MAFPPVKTFIVHRSNWYSRTASVSLITGTLFSSEYPLTNMIDGSIGPMTRFATSSVRFRITLTGPQNTNIIGIFNHNLDPQLLVQPYVNGVALSRTFSVQYPNCWIDLRGFGDPLSTGISVTTVDLAIYGNSRPIAISEVAVAGAYLFDGTIEVPFDDQMTFAAIRQQTEHKKVLESNIGTFTRTLPLNLQVNSTELGYLTSIWADVGEHGERVIVVPTTRRNDIWLVRWPMERKVTYPKTDLFVKVPLQLVEEAAGVVV